MIPITIFTPTYNRADLLPRLFDSLCTQTCKEFEWLIIDDGSTDNTNEVVKGFEADFPIRYKKKPNGGKHTAVNLGVKEAKGELFFIVDSDDYLPADALQIVAEEYAKIKDDTSIGGVAGLDRFADGRTVGNGLPCESVDCNAMDIRFKHHVTGDMKEVFRTEVLKEFPFPEIVSERFCPEQLVWFRIAQKYKLHYFNRPIYIAEYQEGGITAGITRARMKSPIASMMCYAEMVGYDAPFMQKVKAAINYWRFRFCVKDGTCPTINPIWALLASLAYIMHLRDLKCLK